MTCCPLQLAASEVYSGKHRSAVRGAMGGHHVMACPPLLPLTTQHILVSFLGTSGCCDLVMQSGTLDLAVDVAPALVPFTW